MRLEDVVGALGDHCDEAILVTEPGGAGCAGRRILWCNESLLRQTSYAREEILGRDPRLFQGPGTDAATVARIGAALRRWLPVRADVLNYARDGRPFWADLSIQPVPDATGWVWFWVGVQRDVTERKAHEFGRIEALEDLQRRAAREAEISAQLEGLGRNAPGALYQTRVERDGRRRLTFWSPTLPALFGVPPTAVSVRALMEAVHPADLPGLRAAVSAAEAAETALDHAYRIRHPEKGERWLRSVAAPRRAPDGARLWDGHVLDVTDHRRALAEAEGARVRAQAASEAKSRFLARMSHELRTPLNAVLGLAALMEHDGLPPAQAARLAALRDGGMTLLRLLGDLLEVAEIEEAAPTLEVAPFRVAALAERLEAAHRAAAEAKGLGFSVRVIAHGESQRSGDVDQVARIAAKLIDNAVKFTETGAVAVRLIDGDPADDALRIEVEDTGPGVAEPDAARVFAAFGQAEEGPTRRHGGAGLGLTLAQRMARAMGGEVSLSSAPGRGATFSVRLPLPRIAPADPAALRGLRALVAEDSAAATAQLAGLLATAGVVATLAPDGRAAERAYAPGGFDVLLLDLGLPCIDGFETLRRLRAADAARGAPPTPALAVTARTLDEELDAQRAAGFDGHVAKPVRREALLAEIARVTARAPVGTR